MRTALMVAAADGSLAAVRPGPEGRCSSGWLLACAPSMRMTMHCVRSWLASVKLSLPELLRVSCARMCAAALQRLGPHSSYAPLVHGLMHCRDISVVPTVTLRAAHVERPSPAPQVKLLVEEGRASLDSTDRWRLAPHDMHPACP